MRSCPTYAEIVASQLGGGGGMSATTARRQPCSGAAAPRSAAGRQPTERPPTSVARSAARRPARARDGCGHARRRLAVASVGLTVLGPKILGNATNVIFEASSARSCRRASPSSRPSHGCARRARARPPTCVSRHATSCPARASTSRQLRARAARRARPSTCGVAVRLGCRATSWPASRSAPVRAASATSRRS